MGTNARPGHLEFFGPFEVLRALELPDLCVTDVYEGFHGAQYARLARYQRYDLPVYQELADACGDPVLDLGCGAGRIGLHIAAAGHEVVGLDRSRDMLTLHGSRQRALGRDAATRVATVHADMTAFDLGRRFRLIILGCTTICLLHAPQARSDLFRCVARHLHHDGRFAFDYVDTNDELLRLQDDRILAFPRDLGDTKGFTLLGLRHYPEERIQLVNLYSELLDGRRTRRYLSYDRKWIVDIDTVEHELAAAGMRVAARRTLVDRGPRSPDTVRLVVCEAA